MSKDSNKNLEDFFRNSLKDYSENPSNDLWDRIEENIPAKPSRKVRPAYLLIALLFLLTVGFGYEYFQFKNQMLSVNETVNLQKQELDELKSELEGVKEELNTGVQSTENEVETSAQLNDKLAENSIPKNTNDLVVSDQVNKASRSTSPTYQKENRIIVAASEDETNVQLNSNQSGTEIINSSIENETVIALNGLESKSIVVDYQMDRVLPLLPVTNTKKGKAVSVELYASALKTFPNSTKTSDSQVKVDNWQLSSDFGALFNLGLGSNWDVQIGVGYNRMVINDAFTTELIYARDEFDQGRDAYISSYSYSVDTPAGKMEINSSISNRKVNDGRDLEEGDPFNIELQYQDEIHYFQVPVFVRYKMGSGKYRFTMKGGFIQKFLLDERIKLNSANPEFDRLESDMTAILGDQTSASTTSVDALFGAGVEFRMSLKNSIHLQSTFSYSLQEIYPGMKPYSVGLQLGFQHQLGR